MVGVHFQARSHVAPTHVVDSRARGWTGSEPDRRSFKGRAFTIQHSDQHTETITLCLASTCARATTPWHMVVCVLKMVVVPDC